jgi:thioredoxin 1
MRSPIFTTHADQSTDLREALLAREFLVVSLCAAWCGTCTDFSEAFAALAIDRPDATFVWIDIEDDAAIAGDIDVENFPTLAIFHRGRLLHFGISLPTKSVVSRVLSSLTSESPSIASDPQVERLPTLLQHHTEGRDAAIER